MGMVLLYRVHFWAHRIANELRHASAAKIAGGLRHYNKPHLETRRPF